MPEATNKRALKYSASKENYLKAIFHLQQQAPCVSTNALARALQTTAASVTDMLQKLDAQKLLQYEKYKGVTLTEEGREVAVFIIRKHRLWEYFMVQKLGFGWDEVHEIAEELEHVTSIQLINRLEAFLDFPRTDPHGDPIPDRQGHMPDIRQVCLAEFPVNLPSPLSHIGAQSAEIMELLQHRHITIGTELEVLKKFNFDHSLEVRAGHHPVFTVSEHLARNLFVLLPEPGTKNPEPATSAEPEKKKTRKPKAEHKNKDHE